MIDPGEPERPWEPDEENQKSPAIRTLTVIVGLLVISFAVYSRSTGRLTWVLLCSSGSWLAYSVVSDIRRGLSSVSAYGDDPRYDYVRSADPVGYWVVIVIKGAVAATAVGFGLGLLLKP
jgi:hypothetical protein